VSRSGTIIMLDSLPVAPGNQGVSFAPPGMTAVYFIGDCPARERAEGEDEIHATVLIYPMF
jgi:hypothetical protein